MPTPDKASLTSSSLNGFTIASIFFINAGGLMGCTVIRPRESRHLRGFSTRNAKAGRRLFLQISNSILKKGWGLEFCVGKALLEALLEFEQHGFLRAEQGG